LYNHLLYPGTIGRIGKKAERIIRTNHCQYAFHPLHTTQTGFFTCFQKQAFSLLQTALWYCYFVLLTRSFNTDNGDALAVPIAIGKQRQSGVQPPLKKTGSSRRAFMREAVSEKPDE
jgi:hypothetical protein